MPATADLASIQDVLEFIGFFVSVSIAYVSYKGLKQTESPSMLRLTTAFTFLGIGFLVEGLVGLEQFVPSLTTTLIASLLIAGPLLETTGYFFLAFSHVVDVFFAKRLGGGGALFLLPVISVSVTQATNALGVLSFYFIIYGVVETLYAYSKTRRPDTLLTAAGLCLLGIGIVSPLLSLLYPAVDVLSLVEIILKEMGLMILFVPVLNYALGGSKLNGTL